jgi:phosphatidylserine/phosphatidylglycerophosphate/cardiolipin synthase-like enzyme
MAIKFIKGSELNIELERLIEDADDYLYLICPYIQLHDKLKRELKTKTNQPQLRIVVVFGKNEEGLHNSLNKEDFEFLKTLPNIEIRYEPKLHAKYYSSEDRAIITSMNLHKFSHDNNIEVGLVMDVKNIIGKFVGDDPESESYHYFEKVIEYSDLKYKREPVFQKKLLGLSTDYLNSSETVNLMDEVYAAPKPVGFKSWDKKEAALKGYCIRTGAEIPFNLEKPYCFKAYTSWVQFSNRDYPEKYCHFSGEESNGDTTFATPILKKNYRKAKTVFNF